jgi:dCMP deaminase
MELDLDVQRRDKHNYYLDIADTVLRRGTCLRRNYGTIIVKNDEIISTGYAGAPRKRQNCIDLGFCLRQRLNVPRGQMYEICRSVHSEVNAIISASRRDMIGATLYMVGREAKDDSIIRNASSCSMCKRIIINAGIETVIIRDDSDKFRIIDVQSWVDNDDSLMSALPSGSGY